MDDYVKIEKIGEGKSMKNIKAVFMKVGEVSQSI